MGFFRWIKRVASKLKPELEERTHPGYAAVGQEPEEKEYAWAFETREAITRHRFVGFGVIENGGDLLVSITDLNGRIDGVSLEDAPSGGAVGVVEHGNGMLEVDGSKNPILPGDPLRSNMLGVGIKLSPKRRQLYGAIARDFSRAKGDVIRVEIRQGEFLPL